MPVVENITPWQRVTGPAMAGNWCRMPVPPLEPEKAGFYAAALPLAAGETRSKIALCLLWCDAEAGRYCPAYFDYYRAAFNAHPTDERAAFYITALCSGGVLEDGALQRDAYARVLSPELAKSRFWKKFLLNPDRLRTDLAYLYLAESEVVTPDRLQLVEQALEMAVDGAPERIPFATYVARAFRANGRQDSTAEIVYRFLFINAPEDAENNGFLARIYHEHQRRDSNACAVYARMATQCEAEGSHEEANRWILRLAQCYLSLNRGDESTLNAYQKAHEMMPDDRNIEAGYIVSLARRPVGENIEETAAILEDALTRESELRSHFDNHYWNWGMVVRALAICCGRLQRFDEGSGAIYSRAAQLFPDERELWMWQARSLALSGDYSAKAIPVYERAVQGGQADDSLKRVLSTAYIINKAYEGEHRVAALRVWEDLFRQGDASTELVDALSKAYVAEERVNEIALMLWERALETDTKNGALHLRLGQEWRARSEFEKALGYYQAAARLLPKNFAAQFETATLIVQLTADYPTAIKMLQKAIKLPDGAKSLDAHFALAEALVGQDKREEAKAIYQKIINEIDANHTQTLLRLAKLNLKYEEEGVKQAEALYDKALSVSPEHPETYRKLAELYREKGQSEDEQAALEKYLELSQPDAEKYRQLADLYIRRGDFVRAEGALRQVITLGNADKNTYILLGEVILQARQKSKK